MAIVLFAFAGAVRAEGTGVPDSLRHKRSSFVALPYAYYTPETKFAFGVGSIHSFRPSNSSPGDRPSNVRLALTYTQRKQIILACLPELYFGKEAYYINGYYGLYKYPDKFWGVGGGTPDDAEEVYEPLWFRSYTNVQRRIVRGLYVGIRYQFEYI